MRLKTLLARVLRRWPPLFRLSSRLLHFVHGGFRPLSVGGPDAVRKAFELARELRGSDPGDYYEFGVFRGYTFYCAWTVARSLGLERMRFYGFDSFEGLPSLEAADLGGGEFFEGQFACSRQATEEHLRKRGVDLDRAQLIEGFYADSLTEGLRQRHEFRRAAIVMLDCDLYSSTRDALTWMEPYLHDSAILLFDDWKSYDSTEGEGQPRAFAEWLEGRPGAKAEHLWDFPHNGRAFLLRQHGGAQS
jgi:O-methyltransferase